MAGKDPKVEMLRSIPIFSKCGTHDLEQVAQLVDEIELPAGKTLIREGDRGAEMFLLVSGKARVERKGKTIGEFGPGAVLGEMALISEAPRNATVTAIEPLRAFVVAHREFHSLMDGHPQFRMKVFEGLAEKVRRLEEDGVN